MRFDIDAQMHGRNGARRGAEGWRRLIMTNTNTEVNKVQEKFGAAREMAVEKSGPVVQLRSDRRQSRSGALQQVSKDRWFMPAR